MEIIDFEKISLQDFPGVISAIGYTRGCPLRCPYCHNPILVLPKLFNRDIENQKEKFIAYLKKRKGIIEGVVISGGEPLMQKTIEPFLEEIKGLELSIKLDTNGMYPIRLRELLEKVLVDYVALDFKGYQESFNRAVGYKACEVSSSLSFYDEWMDSLSVIKSSGIAYELRTTIVKEIHSMDQIRAMGEELERLIPKEKPIWFLQTYERANGVLGEITLQEPILSPYTKKEMEVIKKEIEDLFPTIQLRS